MAGWESLRVDLRRLLEESPDALVVFPDPDSERREERIRIHLAAWATDIAATLNAKYGSLVDLRGDDLSDQTVVGAEAMVRALVRAERSTR
jgi:hypothetical protein